MKVFQIIPHLDVGGCERVAINIAKSKTVGFEYHVVEIYRGRGDVSNTLNIELERAGVVLHKAPKYALSPKVGILLFPFWFMRLTNSVRPDIIHLHNEISLLAYFLFCKTTRIQKPELIVETVHSCQLWNKWKLIGKIVEKYYQNNGKQVAVSNSVAQMYNKEYGATIDVIYNGVEELQPKDFKNIVPDAINILFAARLEEEKGVRAMIEFVSRLSAYSSLHFHIVGDGSFSDLVNRSLSAQVNVSLYHRIHNIAAILGSFDFVFMPSLFEGLPMLSIESSIVGTPVIANDCPSIVESLPDNWPLLVHNNNVNEYLYIFKNIGNFNREALSKLAQGYAKQYFSIRRMQNEYEKQYLAEG